MPRAVPTPAHHYHPFVRRLATALRNRCKLDSGGRVLLAVSGGADSVALMHAMSLLADKRTWHLRLAVAHVQHHLRPDDEAETDAHSVALAAHRLRLPFLRADLDPAKTLGESNVESWARKARYEALTTLARSFGAAAIVTAHHADDQLETLLMRLMRGAALRGLSSIPWRRTLGDRVLLRPMLHHTRAEAETFLRSLQVPWRVDATNSDITRLRARLRNDVTPLLELISPGIAVRGARAADELRRAAKTERASVQLAIRVSVKRRGGRIIVDRGEARRLPAELLGSMLRELFVEAGASGDRLTRRTLTPIVRAVRDQKGGTRRFAMARGCEALLSREALIISQSASGEPSLSSHK